MQILEPLTVRDVRFTPRNVLGMMSIHQADLEAASFQNLKQRNPVHAGRFHGHGLDSAAMEPIGEGVEVLRERWKAPDRVLIAGGRHRHKYFSRSDINAGRVWVNHQRSWRRLRPILAFSSHHGLLDCNSQKWRPRPRKKSTLLNGITRFRITGARVTTDWSTEPGTKL